MNTTSLLQTEDDIEALVKWYANARKDLVRDNYFSNHGLIKRLFYPYSDWDKAEVLQNEVRLTVQALAKLKEISKREGRSVSTEQLSLLVLALKNRLEFASTQADFYPVYLTFVVVLMGALSLFFNSLTWKFLVGLVLVVLATILVSNRFETRLRLSRIKELVNLLEAFAKDHA